MGWDFGKGEGLTIEESVISGFPGSLMLGLDFNKCQPLIPICIPTQYLIFMVLCIMDNTV